MKKTLFVIIISILSGFAVKAQDTIVQTDGQKVIAKVLEITPDLIKYKKFDNPDGPIFSIQKSKVYMIVYQNGTQDIITKKVVPTNNDQSDGNVEYKPIDKNDKPKATTVTYSKVEYKKTISDNNIRHLVKLNPLLIFLGDIPVYYEHRISDHVSIEAGLGMTMTDYYLNLTDEIITDNVKTKIGYSLVGSAHFYPSKYYLGMQEIYFSPELRLRNYFSEVVQYGSKIISPAIDQKRIMTDFQIKVGYINYFTDNVFVDYYAGIGIRNRVMTVAEIQDIGNALSITMKNSNDLVPCISAGVKIGFGW